MSFISRRWKGVAEAALFAAVLPMLLGSSVTAMTTGSNRGGWIGGGDVSGAVAVTPGIPLYPLFTPNCTVNTSRASNGLSNTFNFASSATAGISAGDDSAVGTVLVQANGRGCDNANDGQGTVLAVTCRSIPPGFIIRDGTGPLDIGRAATATCSLIGSFVRIGVVVTVGLHGNLTLTDGAELETDDDAHFGVVALFWPTLFWVGGCAGTRVCVTGALFYGAFVQFS